MAKKKKRPPRPRKRRVKRPAKQIAAKPTTYRGVKFKSRLEARHAVFYDKIRVAWEYEPDKYELGNGWVYTPDFCLPAFKLLIEVKPIYPVPDYLHILQLVNVVDYGFVLAIGGFWKGETPELFDLYDGLGLKLHTLLRQRQKTVAKAVKESGNYRFDI